MKRIGDDVKRELARFGPVEGMAEIVSAWPEAVGEVVAENAWPARLARDGTLHVATSSSTWAFELAQLEREIESRLRAAVGKDAPRALRFAPGRLPERTLVEESQAVRRPPEASERDLAEGAQLAAAISDENLRKVVARAAAASLARASAGRGVW
jgi:predicted nucleic acid-binding Zn ribbon protein